LSCLNTPQIYVPIFSDYRRRVSQLDRTRGIERTVNAGAHIINISGGQLTDFGETDGWLENVMRLCDQQNVLLTAATVKNDGKCLEGKPPLKSNLCSHLVSITTQQ